MTPVAVDQGQKIEVSLGRKSGFLYTHQADRVQKIIERVCPPIEKVENKALRMGYETRNALTGQRISEVSEQYTIVDNKRLLMPFIEHFGIEAMRELRTYGHGKYLHVSFDTGRQFDMGQGDVINERLVVTNSYDKTRAFSFMLA